MTLVEASIGVVSGAGLAIGGWRMLGETFAKPIFGRANVRGSIVPVGVGIILALALIATTGVFAVLDAADLVDVGAAALPTMTLGAVGFGLLGLFDDLAGDGSSRGFSGHLRSLLQGRLTTGAVKLFGGGAVAVIVVAAGRDPGLGWLLVDAALVALAANLANLFDRAPGRVTKVALVLGAVLGLAAEADVALLGPLVVLAAAAGLLVPELREQLMLGDTGANVVGASLGLGAVLTMSGDARVGIVIALVVLNAISEKISFSRVIERVEVLRRIDGLGRLR